MDAPTDKTPPPLDYTAPSAPRPFSDALADLVRHEMGEGGFQPSRRERLFAWLAIGAAIVAGIFALFLASR